MSDNPYSPPAAENGGNPIASGRVRLVPVAIALLFVSTLWAILALSGIGFFLWAAAAADEDRERRTQQLMYASYLAVEVIYCVVLVSGGFSMIGRGSYTWAVVVSCLACVPCLSPFYAVGIPIGIWALVVLRRAEVKAAFRKL
ncbi:MAG TPA: hypothetical protein VFI31_20490 [Pirellulales bacterium]|nr:hypothetical protein [Pirellulales bacterium]